MSYPYPQDRTRDRQEKGDQPYSDAKEAMAQQDAGLENQVTSRNAPDIGPTSTEDVSDEMIDRLRRVNKELGRHKHDESGEATERP